MTVFVCEFLPIQPVTHPLWGRQTHPVEPLWTGAGTLASAARVQHQPNVFQPLSALLLQNGPVLHFIDVFRIILWGFSVRIPPNIDRTHLHGRSTLPNFNGAGRSEYFQIFSICIETEASLLSRWPSVTVSPPPSSVSISRDGCSLSEPHNGHVAMYTDALLPMYSDALLILYSDALLILYSDALLRL